MAVYKHTYRPYDGPLTPLWSRFLVIPHYAYRSVFQSRFFLVFFILCFIPALGCAVIIYLRHNLDALAMLQIPIDQFISIDTDFFLTLLNIQGWLAFVMTIYLGPGLVSPDLTNNALPLYLSRPFSKTDYVMGKLSVLMILQSFITWVPVWVLYVLQSSLAGPAWFFDNLRILLASLVGGGIWILTLSLLAVAVSAWVRWKPVAGAVLAIIFFGAAGFGGVINVLYDTNLGNMTNLLLVIDRVWTWLFLGSDVRRSFLGFYTTNIPLWLAWTTLLSLAGVCLLALKRKIKAYEVVR